MNRLRRLFLHDLGRKALALVIAVFVWWRVALSIAVTQSHNFQVIQVAETGTPVDHSLEIEAPEGWLLVTPRSGSSSPIRFKGTVDDLTDFFELQCAATYKAIFNAGDSDDNFTINVTPEELEWLRPSNAKVLLSEVGEQKAGEQKAGEQKLTLEFERAGTYHLPLAPGHVDIVGSPRDSFEVVRDGIVFDPNGVTLSGPVSEVRGIEQLTQKGDLLTKLQIPIDAAQDMRRILRLSDTARANGLVMVPEVISVVVPIRANYPLADTGWAPRESAFHMVGTPPSAPAEGLAWTFDPPTGAWRVNYRPEPGLTLSPRDITDDFLHQHVQFLLPLNLLPTDALDGASLTLEVKIVSGDLFETVEERRLLERSLHLAPLNDEGWKVRMKLQ